MAPAPLHFSTYGQRQAPPLLLLHGGGTDSSTFAKVANRLGEKFFVIIPDLPGHGQSPLLMGDYTLQAISQTLCALLNHLDVSTTHVLGHSHGGRLAAQFSALFAARVRSIIIEDVHMVSLKQGSADEQEETRELTRTLSGLDGVYPSLEALTRHLLETGRFSDINTARLWAERISTPYPPLAASALETESAPAVRVFHPDVTKNFDYFSKLEDLGGCLAKLHELEKPLLLLRANYHPNKYMSDEHLAHFLKHAPHTLVILIDGTRHNIHHKRPDEFIAAIESFLLDSKSSASAVSAAISTVL